MSSCITSQEEYIGKLENAMKKLAGLQAEAEALFQQARAAGGAAAGVPAGAGAGAAAGAGPGGVSPSNPNATIRQAGDPKYVQKEGSP